jgi:hypothetical protein
MIKAVIHEDYCNGNLVRAKGYADQKMDGCLQPINDDSLIYKYEDGEVCDWDNPRVCPKCKMMKDKDGYDHCLGYLPGVAHACCGHGVVGREYVIIEIKN